ncbi:uracil-DNA glycosylase family protein [Flagellimonas sp.]|uniref:uracil-DNA glycosylase family protein n=1 Tax=Flagellimonas sp. TaxID=2058762 RepID=UPI003BAD5723
MKDQIKSLFKDIYGGQFDSLNQEYLMNRPKRAADDKCYSCGKLCPSFKNRQDLPYFKSIDKVKTLIVAEAPGKGLDVGKDGFVFGWEQFENKNSRKTISSYKNYFFGLLGLNPENVYLTDGVKCYTDKRNFPKVFENCKTYLEREIGILRPEKILVVSKQVSLIKFLKSIQATYNFSISVIPHPSNQNMSKIPTVGEIFKKVGAINNNEEWIKLGEQIQKEYKSLRKELDS